MTSSTHTFSFICGSDEFLVQRKGASIWEHLQLAAPDEYSREIIDGAAGNVAEVGDVVSRFISSVQTISLFGETKAIWFKDINFLADSVTGRSEGAKAEVEKLIPVLEKLDPSVHVLLTASPVDRRRKTFKWFQSHSDYHFLEEGKDLSVLIRFVQKEAKDLGVDISPSAAEVLLGKINANSRLALEELSKLATYLGEDGGQITEALVTDLVPNFGDGDFFETVEAFYALDLNWTMAAIRRHFFAGYDGRPMITSLQNRNRLLIQLKGATLTGNLRGRPSKQMIDSLESDVGRYYGEDRSKSAFNVLTQHPFYLGKLSQNLQRISLKDLIDFQLEFCEAFRGILNFPNDQERVMREVAIRCLGRLA